MMLPVNAWQNAPGVSKPAGQSLAEIGADWHNKHRPLSEERRDRAVSYIVTIVRRNCDMESVDLAARQLWRRFREVFDDASPKDTDNAAFARAMRLI